MWKTYHVVVAGALLMGATGCSDADGDGTGSPDAGDTDPAEVDSADSADSTDDVTDDTADTTDAGGDSAGDADAGGDGTICLEHTGEVTATPEFAEGFGIAGFAYRADFLARTLEIDVRGESGLLGTAQLTFPDAETPLGGDGTYAMTTADGSSAEWTVSTYTRRDADRVVRTRSDITADGVSVRLEQDLGETREVTSARWYVPFREDIFPDGGGAVSLGDGAFFVFATLDEDAATGWLRSAGADAVVDSEAVRLITAIQVDGVWREALAQDMIACGIEAGELDPGEFQQKLQIGSCYQMVGGCIGTGLCIAAGCGGLAGCALCGLGGLQCINDVYECSCGSDGVLRASCFPCDGVDCGAQCPCGGQCNENNEYSGRCTCFGSFCCQNECSCTRGCSGGDPHLVTFDGTLYSSYAVGEFWLARSDDGVFAVQSRQEPMAGCNLASRNTAAAVSMGADAVMFSWETTEPIRLSDGRRFALAETTIELPAGRIEVEAFGRAAVVLNSGDVVVVTGIGQGDEDFLNIDVRPSLTRVGAVSGLLGNFDGNSENDIERPFDVLPGAPIPATEAREWSNRWRIAQDDSLFVYDDGQTTDTFTDLDAPLDVISVAGLDAEDVAAAEIVCAAVPDDGRFDRCVVDVVCGEGDDGAVAFFTDLDAPELVLDLVPDVDTEACGATAEGLLGTEPAVGTTQTVVCPPGCEAPVCSIWGTGTYTSDSLICGAAIHAGAIPSTGGEVTFRVLASLDEHPSSDQNGISSCDWGSGWFSYVFE